jgi:hypothetical protein
MILGGAQSRIESELEQVRKTSNSVAHLKQTTAVGGLGDCPDRPTLFRGNVEFGASSVSVRR